MFKEIKDQAPNPATTVTKSPRVRTETFPNRCHTGDSLFALPVVVLSVISVIFVGSN